MVEILILFFFFLRYLVDGARLGFLSLIPIQKFHSLEEMKE